ncbi:MAG TPA: hypothetical protein EYQ12_00680 [Oceanospirillaceae bacterium]|nr:hypothetical protein [Oceanospirillaceae bacterium]
MAAAQQGLGVVLASLPLAQQALKSGELVELSPQRLISAAGPWLTAPKDQLSQLDWQELSDLFCS